MALKAGEETGLMVSTKKDRSKTKKEKKQKIGLGADKKRKGGG